MLLVAWARDLYGEAAAPRGKQLRGDNEVCTESRCLMKSFVTESALPHAPCVVEAVDESQIPQPPNLAVAYSAALYRTQSTSSSQISVVHEIRTCTSL